MMVIEYLLSLGIPLWLWVGTFLTMGIYLRRKIREDLIRKLPIEVLATGGFR